MIRRVIAGLAFWLVVSAAAARADTFTPQQHRAALQHIAALIAKNYVYKNVAVAVGADVRNWEGDPVLLAAADRPGFASLLTDRLRRRDGHFFVQWSPANAQAVSMRRPGKSDAAFQREMAADNYGFDTVSRLPGNVGYIRMSFFADFDTSLTGRKTPDARKAAEAALSLVQNTDAVIFDIRDNHGGSPAMIDLLLSGFFGGKPVLLNRFYRRESDRTVDFTTLSNFAGKRRPDVPLFVLISGATGSAAEEFAYDVQTQKRGVLVGGTTYGGANPGGEFDAGDGFSIFISTGAAINPITHTNWERVGVQPDVVVRPADALQGAQELALKAIVARGGGKSAIAEARWCLERLEAEDRGGALAPKTAQEFAGDYDGRVVAVRGAALTFRYRRAPEETLIALGNGKFAFDDRSDERLSFGRDGKGRVDSVALTDLDGITVRHPRGPAKE